MKLGQPSPLAHAFGRPIPGGKKLGRLGGTVTGPAGAFGNAAAVPSKAYPGKRRLATAETMAPPNPRAANATHVGGASKFEKPA